MIEQSHLNIEAIFGSITNTMKKQSGELKGPCPECGGDDRFVINPKKGNGGAFLCRECHPKWGDCIEAYQFIHGVTPSVAMTELGLSPNTDKAHTGTQKQNGSVATRKPKKSGKSPAMPIAPSLSQPFTSSKRAYTGLADYCKQKNIPLDFVERFGWSEGEHNNRPCIVMKHNDGGLARRDRVRYLDEKGGFQPVSKWEGEQGFHRCFYGFGRAIDGAKGSKHRTIILTNGQSSVMVANFHGLHAFAQTDGEVSTGLQPDLLKRLVKEVKRSRLKVIIALDADTPGRDMAGAVSAQLAHVGIDAPIVDFGGHHGYDLADYCKQHTTQSFNNLRQLALFRGGQAMPEVDNETMANELENTLIGQGGIRGEVIEMPLTTIAAAGGFARLMIPGMLTYIYGKSGAGKTSFVETMVEKFLQAGVHVLWWSPEWTHTYIKWRQIQRSGAATFEELLLHSAKIKPFTQEQKRKISKASDGIDAWPGKLWVYQTDKFTEDIITRMRNRVAIMRRDNPQVKVVCCFDYAQLMKTATEEPNRSAYETATDMIKTFCGGHALHSIVTVQVEKALRNKDILGMYDAQWVRPDYANLILTLNMRMQDDALAPDGKSPMQIYKNRLGQPLERTHYLMAVNIAKNSMGRTPVIEIPTDFERLAVLDTAINRRDIQ